jgi:hypothetical protein
MERVVNVEDDSLAATEQELLEKWRAYRGHFSCDPNAIVTGSEKEYLHKSDCEQSGKQKDAKENKPVPDLPLKIAFPDEAPMVDRYAVLPGRERKLEDAEARVCRLTGLDGECEDTEHEMPA